MIIGFSVSGYRAVARMAKVTQQIPVRLSERSVSWGQEQGGIRRRTYLASSFGPRKSLIAMAGSANKTLPILLLLAFTLLAVNGERPASSLRTESASKHGAASMRYAGPARHDAEAPATSPSNEHPLPDMAMAAAAEGSPTRDQTLDEAHLEMASNSSATLHRAPTGDTSQQRVSCRTANSNFMAGKKFRKIRVQVL